MPKPEFNVTQQRRKIMQSVKTKNTAPEMAVRRALHAMGHRYRLHKKELPGTPDIVLPKSKKAIFVHGCFWHGHARCSRAKMPATNSEYWKNKMDANKKRHRKAQKELEKRGGRFW